MSTPAVPVARGLDPSALTRRFSIRPAEGWLTVAMVALLAGSFALSVNDAGWVPASEGSTGYLIWLAVASVAFGLLAAKAGLGRWRTDLAGAILAGLLLPLIAGSIALGPAAGGFDPASIALRYRAAGDVAFRVWADLVRDGRPFTDQFAHYHMVFGALVWAAGQLAATAVFARRRPLDAVVVVGFLTLANMAVTARDQLWILVIFSVAALVLLIRAHSFEEQVTWMRRRIGDPAAVSALYLRGGGSFITAAVIGALFLTVTASSAPLQGAWADVPQRLIGLSQWLQRYAPTGGEPRPLGVVGFGSSATTQGLWSPSDAVAFRAKLAPSEQGLFKWRAGTYAVYDGVARWSWGETGTVGYAANTPLLAGTGDDPAVDTGRREFQATITPDALGSGTIVSPETIEQVDRPSVVRLDETRFTTIESSAGSGPYSITALVPVAGGTDGLTQNRLRIAGSAYPNDIIRNYLGVPKGALGPASLAILADVQQIAAGAGGPKGNAYDLAFTVQQYLRSSRFTYSADVRDLVRQQCSGMSTVECFATIRTGYCEYYASTMAILLRKEGIPTRIAYGFLPSLPAADGTETVMAAASHWWVEVYFPKYGWVEFDPTGDVGRPQSLPSGAVETPHPTVLSTPGGTELPGDLARRTPSGQTPGSAGTTSSGSGPFIAIAILLAVGIGALALTARRRAPRKPMHPDQAWGSLGRLASRFGFGPRPTQTVYEYAGVLGDAVPRVRADLTTVARAKVEVAYGRQELGVERMRSIGDAYRRLRFAIIRFGLRPRRRRG
jgi:transglutaminase-like putative cysteine protease